MIDTSGAKAFSFQPAFLHALLAAVCTALLAGHGISAAAAEDALQKDARIVFLGDSITQAGAAPGGYVSLVREALEMEYPDRDIKVIGAGISGNKVPDLQKRLERDVLSKQPTTVVIYIGINDVWHWQRDQGTPKEKFEAGLKEIIGKIQKAGADVILTTSSVIGEKADGTNKMDEMLEEYSAISRQVAKETEAQLLDLRKAFIAYLKEHNPQGKEKGVLTTDGVHLNAAGNKFVANEMLAALGADTGVAGASSAQQGKAFRHVVLFSFKEGTSPEKIREIEKAFAALPEKIDVIKDFEWGTDASTEGLAQGFTHCFFVTFADEEGRDTYLPHPAHKEFVQLVRPHLEKVLVVDYWAR